MGGKKKKSSAAPIKRESKYKIPKLFRCPECDTKKCVRVRINRKNATGTVQCLVCGAGRSVEDVKRLEEAVDVYYKFRDEVDREDEPVDRGDARYHGTLAMGSLDHGEGLKEPLAVTDPTLHPFDDYFEPWEDDPPDHELAQ